MAWSMGWVRTLELVDDFQVPTIYPAEIMKNAASPIKVECKQERSPSPPVSSAMPEPPRCLATVKPEPGQEYRVKPKYPVPSAVNHVASQTDLPSIELPGTRTVSTQLNKESISNLRSTDTQVRVRSRDCGVCTETLPLDSPLLLPDARPEKRPRLSLAEEEEEEEEEEEGPSESSRSTVVQDKTNLT
ncbi:uncharacterized protein LOC110366861 isoform X3 [Fundulus heteroclitus]|uniref:uncharacterized protein LOC110366861 isoform X3 n=1 Tax=Fundulus heteroclitus TaxID=8078 RepID=UPI00165AB14F|nr:uncharacterized protein LOC110366861 isoform X3 [Fundulus heteroclitus]XP_035987099.1 uncharacterized protein LOC110366861 isoform X3 [Fundulus heteroclitus]